MRCVKCNKTGEIKVRYKWAYHCDECIKEIKRQYGRAHYHDNRKLKNDMAIIYQLNFADGSIYIGSSTSKLKERVRMHFTHSFNDNMNSAVHIKIRQLFTKSTDYYLLLETSSILESVNKDNRYEAEKKWIKLLKPNLNSNHNKAPKIKVPKKPRKGSSHPNSKLDETKVKEIRRLRFDELLTLKELSNIFSVSEMTIHQIVNYKTWNEI